MNSIFKYLVNVEECKVKSNCSGLLLGMKKNRMILIVDFFRVFN